MKGLFRLESLLLGLGACLLFFLAGAAIDHYRVFPYRIVGLGFEAIESIDRNIIRPHFEDPEDTDNYYYPKRTASLGLQSHDPSRAYAGATLFSSAYAPAAFLVGMDGKELHRWSMPFSKAWDRPPHIEVPVPDRFICFRKTYLYPNGDLLAIYEAPGHWPYAYGLVKLDKESNMLWKYADLANHDLDVALDGQIYTLVHVVRSGYEGGPEGFQRRTVVDDALVLLTPDGQEVKRVSILDALARSKYAAVMLEDTKKELMHANSVKVATAADAANHPFVEEGQILLSLRNLSLIAVLDVPTETITWAMRGSWEHQHTARFVDNGTIAVFDNLGHIGEGGRTRILEFDPRTGGVTWEYGGSDDRTFYTNNRGEYQYLPNGNILITESNAGRMFEITRDKKVVWDYVVEHEVDGRVPSVFWAARHELDALPFLAEASQASSSSAMQPDTQ
ncbi:MAG: arylsulfotransferase family protein [Kiloniellales bacterium]